MVTLTLPLTPVLTLPLTPALILAPTPTLTLTPSLTLTLTHAQAAAAQEQLSVDAKLQAADAAP